MSDSEQAFLHKNLNCTSGEQDYAKYAVILHPGMCK
jgi:hypothetical protein